ncbi:uncharacterized protein LOC110389231 isoform X2 [Numida meleagris]|uniref:uncharacterized protein LOC110389231 isoform X2 n=1 Tax=Numida meleagris TaxID=8996 RepID=UPI000B3E1605|nr:uncharacterized protein LOC110389231 isoform X2 [Numida meleagris]
MSWGQGSRDAGCVSVRPSPSRPFVQGLFWLFRGGCGAVLSQALGRDPLTHAMCGAAELAGTWGPAPPHPPPSGCSRAGGSPGSTAPPILSCCPQNRACEGFPGALLALCCEQSWPHLLLPPQTPSPEPPHPPPSFISLPTPFIFAFHLPPGHLVLVDVATPQSAPARCHGTQSILGCPSPISAPPQLLPWLCPVGSPLLCSGDALCQVWGPPSPHPGGLAGPGGGRCPCLGHPLRSPWSLSCTMAIGEELRSGRFWREVLAEAVATFIFTGVVLGASAAPSPLVPALAGGLAAGTLTCALRAPQANPALTLALLCTRKLSALRGAATLLAQCAGAVLAATAARLALPDATGMVTRVSAGGTAGQALAWEIFATFQLALTTFATTNHVALGSAIIAGALAAGPFSGGSMNPARSLGPAIVTGIWDDHWVSHSIFGLPQRPHCGDGCPRLQRVTLPSHPPPGQQSLTPPFMHSPRVTLSCIPKWGPPGPPIAGRAPPSPSLGPPALSQAWFPPHSWNSSLQLVPIPSVGPASPGSPQPSCHPGYPRFYCAPLIPPPTSGVLGGTGAGCGAGRALL